MHLVQSLRYRIEAVAIVKTATTAECSRCCVEGMMIGRRRCHAGEAANKVIGDFEEVVVFV